MPNEIEKFLDFLNASPSSLHAIESTKKILLSTNFQELNEASSWQLKAGGKYFVIRHDSVLCAFIIPKEKPTHARVIGTHVDSPCFKLKPNAEYLKDNMIMLGLEVYGGALITSWLNRDLGIAGQVAYLDNENKLKRSLVNLKKFPVVIPQLAIHLDRQVNETGLLLNKQDQLSALAGLKNNHDKEYLVTQIKREIPHLQKILNADLFLYPLEPARCIGDQNQLISAYKLDNLCSVHAALEALKDAEPHANQIQILMGWNHEEIGSESVYGALSPFFSQVLERMTLALQLSRDDYLRLVSQSLCLSVDLTHALHPNYSNKHEPQHPVLLKNGVAFKFNAQQKYASDAYSSGILLELCQQFGIAYQSFVSRNDIASGATIGPLHASKTGMATVDIGIGILSMHSCRELAACDDYITLKKLLKHFYS